jgi:hypothetical protein
MTFNKYLNSNHRYSFYGSPRLNHKCTRIPQTKLFLLATALGYEADYSPPSSAEVKECVELYIHSPTTPLWRGAQLKHSVNFIFYLYLSFLLPYHCRSDVTKPIISHSSVQRELETERNSCGSKPFLTNSVGRLRYIHKRSLDFTLSTMDPDKHPLLILHSQHCNWNFTVAILLLAKLIVTKETSYLRSSILL